MPTQVQFRRGTTAQNNNFTGASGEISVNTSNNTIRVHDGSTVGGFELATVSHVSNSIANVIGSAPAVLDTLNEIATAINSDPQFYANVASSAGAARDQANTAYVAAVAAFNSGNTKVTTVAGVSSTSISNVQLASGVNQTGILNTSNVIEGANLYYTVDRANTAIDNRVTKSFVDNLNVDADTLDGLDSTAFALDTDLTTANVTELNNLYFTNARVKSYLTSVDGNIVPASNITYDLGNTTHRFKDLWLSGTTINLGSIKLKESSGGLQVTNAADSVLFTASSSSGVTSVNSRTGAVTGLAETANGLSQFASTTSSELAGIVSDETGSGALVFATSPTLVTPILGTPQSGNFSTGTFTWPTFNQSTTGSAATLTTARAINGVSFNGSADITVTAAAGTLSGATLASGVTASSLTSVGTLSSLTVTNNVSAGAFLTAGSSTAGTFQTAGNVNSSSLRVTTASSLGTVQSGTWQGTSISTTYTDAKVTSVNGSTGAVTGLATTAGTLAQFGATTSSQLAGVISDETGSGALVFATSPTLVTPNLGTPSTIVLTNASGTASALTANIANFINVTDDTSTNATRYPIFANGTSGAITEQVSSTKLFFNPSTGLLTSTDYNSSSDKRLKKNIKTVENALDKVTALRGVTFDWKEGGSKAIGLIAQEAQAVIPEIVTKDDNGYLGIKYTNLIGVLVEAIKEQQDQINTLKKLIEKQ